MILDQDHLKSDLRSKITQIARRMQTARNFLVGTVTAISNYFFSRSFKF